MGKYHVRLTLTVEADDAGGAVEEFAMNLAEFGTLNWLFFVENLETGEASYVNRSGEDLDEDTLRYMKQTLDTYNARSNNAVEKPAAEQDPEALAQLLLDADGNS